MSTSKETIRQWFLEGIQAGNGYMYMFVVCDTFSYEDYPVFLKIGTTPEQARKAAEAYNRPSEMSRLMEVYFLMSPMEEQLARKVCFEYGSSLGIDENSPARIEERANHAEYPFTYAPMPLEWPQRANAEDPQPANDKREEPQRKNELPEHLL